MKAVMTSVGRGLPGRANARLARGRGRFVDDLRPHGTCHVAIVRSPHANALVLGVDLKRALALPGVVAAVDEEEIRRRTNPIPEGWDTSVIEARRVDWYALAAERVRYVGEAVAAVVAADRPTAVAAAELVEVDYQPLPAVTDAHQALRPGAPLVEPAWGDNLLLTQEFAAGDVEDAMTRAFQVVSGQVSSQRITGVPIEPRGILASYDRNQGRLTFWESTQQPHQVRSYLAQALGMPEAGIRVIQPHVGGAFGLKQPTSQEEVLLAFLAVRLGRPLKWIEERSESLAAGGHARETSCRYQAAVGPDGLVTAMRVEIVADVGAPTAFLGWGMSLVTMLCVPTVYRVPAISVRLRSVVTNKCPWTPYRGFGKDVATLLMERVMDHVADRLGADRVDLRLRHLIGPDEFPYRRPSGAVLDSGDYPRALRRVVERAGAASLPAMRSSECASSRATPTPAPGGSATTARGASSSAARRSSWPPPTCGPSWWRWPPACSAPRRTRWSASTSASRPARDPDGRSAGSRSSGRSTGTRSRPTPRGSTRRWRPPATTGSPTSTTSRAPASAPACTRPGPAARSPASSRSTRTPAWSSWSATTRWRTPAGS